jgi:hypothetical protein
MTIAEIIARAMCRCRPLEGGPDDQVPINEGVQRQGRKDMRASIPTAPRWGHYEPHAIALAIRLGLDPNEPR